MRTDGNMGGYTNYYPNSFSNVRDSDNNLDSNFTLNNAVVYRYDDSDDHNYEQPRDLYRSYPDDWKMRLHKNVALAMNGARSSIIDRALEEFNRVDPAYADGIRAELNKLAKKSDQY